MITILSIIGKRSDAVKLAPVIKALGKHPTRFRSVVCTTGQQQTGLQHVLDLFGIEVDYALNMAQTYQPPAVLISNMVVSLDSVVDAVQPNWLLAQGDTTTTLVASLLAYYHQIKFAHLEAGLRSGDKYAPFPHEMHRRIADLMADVFFAPTERARRMLLREDVRDSRIYVTGNTVVDALIAAATIPYDWQAGPLAKLDQTRRIVTVVAHRDENLGDPLREVCSALRELAWRYHTDTDFVFPVDPTAEDQVYEMLGGIRGITLLPPLDYIHFVQLMRRSTLILTDSGGIQEEAPTFEVPVLVLRDKTERLEGVDAGVAKLVGTQFEKIIEETSNLLDNPDRLRAMRGSKPYGSGNAAAQIIRVLLDITR